MAFPQRIKDQGNWVENVKTDGCESCHQLGDKATREIEPSTSARSILPLPHGTAAFSPRKSAAMMSSVATRTGRKRMLTGIRRLDRPHQGRRAPALSAAPARHGAQRSNHRVGLGHAEGIFPR